MSSEPSNTKQQGQHPITLPPETPPAKSKKLGIIVGIIVTVFMLGASVSAYFLWYNKPNKVVADSIMSIFAADSLRLSGKMNWSGSRPQNNSRLQNDAASSDIAQQPGNIQLDYQYKDGRSALTATMMMQPSQASRVELKGSMITEDGDTYYVKIDNPQQLADMYISAQKQAFDSLKRQYETAGNAANAEAFEQVYRQLNEQMKSNMQQLVSTVEGKWIIMSRDTVGGSVATVNSGDAVCLASAMRTIKKDNSLARKFAKLFRKHQFITVDPNVNLESRGSSNGYRLVLDKAMLQKFYDTAAADADMKPVISCLGASVKGSQAALRKKTSSVDTKVDVWIDSWSHRVSSIEVESGATPTATPAHKQVRPPRIELDVVYDAVKSIQKPNEKDSIKIEQLKQLSPFLRAGVDK